VSDLQRRLPEDERHLGRLAVGPPPAQFARENEIVGIGILPTKREPEAPFAVLVPVADSQVATGLGQGGHDVDAKGRRLSARGGGDSHEGGQKNDRSTHAFKMTDQAGAVHRPAWPTHDSEGALLARDSRGGSPFLSASGFVTSLVTSR